MIFLVLPLLIMGSNASTTEVCSLDPFEDVKTIKLPNHPGNYLRFSEDGRYLLSSPNNLFDLSTSPAKHIITSTNDETYLRNGWAVSPNHNDGKITKFFRLSDLASKGTNATPLRTYVLTSGKGGNDVLKIDGYFTDTYNEFYHSVGVKKEGKTTRLRNALWRSGTYRDYIIDETFGAPQIHKGPIKAFCKNLNQNLVTPILSADGNEIALNSSDGRLYIYKILPSGDCIEQEKLPYQTGKVFFSPTEKKSSTENWSRYISFQGGLTHGINSTSVLPSEKYYNGIYIYDRKTKSTYMASKPDEVTFGYSGFTEDGKILYVVRNTENRDFSYHVVVRKIRNLRESEDPLNTSVCTKCFSDPSKINQALDLLVSQWKLACPTAVRSREVFDKQKVVGLITKEQCKLLVEKTKKAEQKSLLAKTCEALK